jgi:uncharacterized protein (DUF2235 family)
MAVPKIVILSDGTGNAASSVWRTNVWRIFQSLDLRSNEQAAKYDDGVGTWSFLPLAILGGAWLRIEAQYFRRDARRQP